MKRLDLIIDALEISYTTEMSTSDRRLCNEALAAARELRELEPVARFNWEAAQFEWLTKYSYDKHHMTPLYVLGESND